MSGNNRAVVSTVFFAVVVAVTGSLVLFLGSTAQAASPTPHTQAGKAHPQPPTPELVASDAWTGDNFGWSVAISGSTAVVGAPYAGSYKGEAYVFTKSGNTWTQTGQLTASDDLVGNEFGRSVAISGTTVAVGSPGADFGIGTAYVFTESGGVWTQQSEFIPTDGLGGDKFGYSVVTTGSSVMVGADTHGETTNNTPGTGAVYVFTDNAGTWSQQAELTASDEAPNDQFGWSMAVSGTTLVVSAVRHAANGAVYVFSDSGGTWSQVAELTAIDGFANDYFGDKVAISGSRIVAGAPGHDNVRGAAYVFSGSGRSWTQVAELTASDGASMNCFGWSVGLSGTTVLVGAEQHNAAAGAAYVFKKSGSQWKQHELSAPGGQAGDEFGYSSSLSGSTAIVSSDNSSAGAGSAYIFKV